MNRSEKLTAIVVLFMAASVPALGQGLLRVSTADNGVNFNGITELKFPSGTIVIAGRTATVRMGAAGGFGSVNTASNLGTAGIGLFKDKSGADLRFKKLNAGSSKVTLTDDTGNNEVDVGIVEANIVHQNLSGAGTNTHAQIDTHIANTSNPHAVTKTQVGLSAVPNVDATVAANITQDSTHRFATDAEKSAWNAKQDSLNGASSTYTPTATPETGSFTSVTTTGNYKLLGNKLGWFEATVLVNTLGTAAGFVTLTLPAGWTGVTRKQDGTGMESNNTGKAVRGLISSGGTSIQVKFSDNTTTGLLAATSFIRVWGLIEIQ